MKKGKAKQKKETMKNMLQEQKKQEEEKKDDGQGKQKREKRVRVVEVLRIDKYRIALMLLRDKPECRGDSVTKRVTKGRRRGQGRERKMKKRNMRRR